MPVSNIILMAASFGAHNQNKCNFMLLERIQSYFTLNYLNLNVNVF